MSDIVSLYLTASPLSGIIYIILYIIIYIDPYGVLYNIYNIL